MAGAMQIDAAEGLSNLPGPCGTEKLFELDQQLKKNDLRIIKFLCADHFPHGELEGLKRPLEMFRLMEQKKRINPNIDDMQYIAECLYFIHRLDLVRKLGYPVKEFKQHMAKQKRSVIPPFRILLVKIYDELTKREFDSLKFFCEEGIGRWGSESITDALDLFTALEQSGYLALDEVDELMDKLRTIDRIDLVGRIEKYKSDYLPGDGSHGEKGSTEQVKGQQSTITKKSYAADSHINLPLSKRDLCEEINTSITTSTQGNDEYEHTKLQVNILSEKLMPQTVVKTVKVQASVNMEPSNSTGGKNTKKGDKSSEQVTAGGDTPPPAQHGGVVPPGALPSFLGAFEDSDDDEIPENPGDEDMGSGDDQAMALNNRQPENEQIQQQLEEKEQRLMEVTAKLEKLEHEIRQKAAKDNLPINAAYKMDRSPRGICLIINNETFEGCKDSASSQQLGNRRGTDIDANKLEKTFTKKGFLVFSYKDLTAAEMIKATSHFATAVDHTDFDCFVCCILTHGEIGKVFGTNGLSIEITTLTGFFRPLACPTLKGKPKLFFLQACQGTTRQRIVDLDLEKDDVPRGVNEVRETIPNEADFLIGLATVPGFVSYRSPSSGSWYIQSLTEHLDAFGSEHDLLSILTYVNGALAASQAKLKNVDHLCGQVPAPMSTLRKKVIFKDVTVGVQVANLS